MRQGLRERKTDETLRDTAERPAQIIASVVKNWRASRVCTSALSMLEVAFMWVSHAEQFLTVRVVKGTPMNVGSSGLASACELKDLPLTLHTG